MTKASSNTAKLPCVPKKTSLMNLYTELAIYKVNLVSVTSTDSWNSLTNKLD